MTSPAIRLAKECGVRYDNGEWQFGGDDAVERFYARAQAKALREAYRKCVCREQLLGMADELDPPVTNVREYPYTMTQEQLNEVTK